MKILRHLYDAKGSQRRSLDSSRARLQLGGPNLAASSPRADAIVGELSQLAEVAMQRAPALLAGPPHAPQPSGSVQVEKVANADLFWLHVGLQQQQMMSSRQARRRHSLDVPVGSPSLASDKGADLKMGR